MLTAIYASSYIDRQLLAVLLTPIKAEFRLSDTAIGFLTGVAFALLYATLGLPIAMIADRTNRKRVVTISLILWSGLTAACGMARSFLDLLLLRIGVGIGEAGGSPASISMISDLFEPECRSRAMAVYALAVPLGGSIGLILGGLIAQSHGWRAAFIALGVPGLLLALLFALSVDEPERQGLHGGFPNQAPPLTAALGFLWRQRAYRHIVLGVTLSAVCGSGVLVWLSAFFIRAHDLSLARSGLLLALIGGPAGALGTFLGGYLADRLQARNPLAPLYVMAGAAALSVPIAALVFLTASFRLACIGLGAWSLVGSAYIGPAFATCQNLAAPRMRAFASALLGLMINLVGYACGPQIVGLLSDWLQSYAGIFSLGYALAATMTLNLIAAAFYFAARSTLRADLERAAAS